MQKSTVLERQACQRSSPAPWTPHQCRHTKPTAQPCRVGRAAADPKLPQPLHGADHLRGASQPQHHVLQSHQQLPLQQLPVRQHRQQQQGQQQQHYIQIRLLSDSSNKPHRQSQPEPHATSGSPGPEAAAASGSKADGNSSSDDSRAPDSTEGPSISNRDIESSNSSSNSSSKPTPVSPGGSSVEDEVDQVLDKLWSSLKQDLKKELPPEQATMLDKWSPSDIQTDKVFREMANHQLGPFLQSMGIEEDPYDFFLDLFRLALCFQLAAAGLVFYTTELGLGGNVGDAFRAVAGLLLGYTLRLGIKVEQLAWPVYNGLVQLLISEGATYEIPPASAEEQRDTINRLGVALAVAFLVPKFAFGWQNDECWQIVVPMLCGLFFFDVAYMFALLIKLTMSSGDEGKK